MGLSTFIGGVHPYEGKELSADKPIQVIQPKGELVYPLSQHIGAPAKPLVAKGDKVLVGQKIAEAGGFISANVICSVAEDVCKYHGIHIRASNEINYRSGENRNIYRNF